MPTDLEKITNLFLYGQETTPTDLIDDELIRPSDPLTLPPEFHVNLQDFMDTGAGRFAIGAQFELVQAFFSNPASTRYIL